MDEVTAIISKEDIKVSYKEGGKKVIKNVTVDDFIGAVEKNLVLRTGILSRGVREFLKSGDVSVVTLEVPPRIRDIIYHDKTVVITGGAGENKKFAEYNYKIPFPPMVFIFEIVSGKLAESWCYATKMPLINDGVNIFLFPLGNVHPDGRICWGDGSFARNTDFTPANVSSLVERFLKAPFNHDLAQNVFVPPDDNVRTTQQLMTYLNNTVIFPNDILKAISSYEKKIEQIFANTNGED